MERHVIWAPWHKPGLEHFRLTYYDDEITGDGLVIAVIDEKALRAGHVIHCNTEWIVHQVEIEIFDDQGLIIDYPGAFKRFYYNVLEEHR